MGMKARRRWVPVDSVSGTVLSCLPGELYKEGSKVLGYIRCSIIIPPRWFAHCASTGSALVDTKAEARAWVKENC